MHQCLLAEQRHTLPQPRNHDIKTTDPLVPLFFDPLFPPNHVRRVLETLAIVVRHVWLAAADAGVIMRTCGRDGFRSRSQHNLVHPLEVSAPAGHNLLLKRFLLMICVNVLMASELARLEPLPLPFLPFFPLPFVCYESQGLVRPFLCVLLTRGLPLRSTGMGGA